MSRKKNKLERKQKKQNKQHNKIKYKKYEEPRDEIVSHQEVLNSIILLEQVEKEVYRETE